MELRHPDGMPMLFGENPPGYSGTDGNIFGWVKAGGTWIALYATGMQPDDAKGYAKRLAIAMHAKHYPEVAHWEPQHFARWLIVPVSMLPGACHSQNKEKAMKTEQPKEPSNAAGGASGLSVELGGFRWEPDKGPWANGNVCYAGKWPVGKVAWASRTKGETKNYGACSRLPGLKELLDYYGTEQEARDRVERASRHWFKNLSPNCEFTGP